MSTDTSIKRKSQNGAHLQADQKPNKRLKLLSDEESGDDSDVESLRINKEYAQRFQHNKQRAELHRLQEKYGDHDHTDDTSSEEESEDEDGEFVNETVDAEIAATISAIKSKDPRIYTDTTKFFSEQDATASTKLKSEDKPMYLRDYHRKNLLENDSVNQNEDHPLPYVLEQANLKRNIVNQINAATTTSSHDNSDDEDDFLVRKETLVSQRTKPQQDIPDPATADQNPETFLSNFFASRAWVPNDKDAFQPLESDDESEEEKAEQFESAWNWRFENPNESNKVLTTHSREVVAKYSVRRDQIGGRKKARELEKQHKEKEKRQRDEERKRLKKLKMSEMELKLEQIREAAGLSGKDVSVDDWADMLEADWDDDKWDQEMQNRFGKAYYDAGVDVSDDDNDATVNHVKKPTWSDDIDVGNIESDEDLDTRNEFQLTDDENEDEVQKSPDFEQSSTSNANPKRDRRIIEALADQQAIVESNDTSTKGFQPFRYRETSPNTFGLSPLDILAADDSQLNQFAGLKKLATFRDPERKKKDKSKLSKKARLRAWRKETFGREDGPAPATIFATEMLKAPSPEVDVEAISLPAKKQKKRKRKSKAATSAQV